MTSGFAIIISMEAAQRKTKQFFTALVFFVIVGGIVFLIYRRVSPPLPPPTPNPTINLAPIRVSFQKLFNVSLLSNQSNDYDFLAKVTNSNTDYGSPDVEYKISFLDLAGNPVSTKTGSFYILPGQTKYVVVVSPLGKFSQLLSNAIFTITSVNWQKLDLLAANGISFVASNVSYSQISQPGTFAKVGGNIFNNSDFDVNQVDVAVVLLDQDNSPIAINKTTINTFLAKTKRGFEVTWVAPFVGQIGSVYAEANTNVFENSNFLRRYGGQKRFQQYY